MGSAVLGVERQEITWYVPQILTQAKEGRDEEDSGRIVRIADGVAEAPNRWVSPYFTDEVGKVVDSNTIDVADAMLLGRRTYEEWAAYWPGKTAEDDPYADFINPIQKYVVSTSLESVEWQNSTLLKGDLREEVEKLKSLPGKDIGIAGSITLFGSLLKLGCSTSSPCWCFRSWLVTESGSSKARARRSHSDSSTRRRSTTGSCHFDTSQFARNGR